MDKFAEVVENTQGGFYWLLTGNVWRRIKLAPYAVYRWYMNIAKLIEPEFVLWLWFMLVGLLQLYFVASNPSALNSLDYITTSDEIQVLISIGLVIYGGMVAYWKQDWMIALGTLIVIAFTVIITKGLLDGGIGLRSVSGLVYILLMVMALIGFTSTRETSREQRRSIEKLEKKVADLTAGLAAKVGEDVSTNKPTR
jgi:hypothetical protein